jgi:hypothetical protein
MAVFSFFFRFVDFVDFVDFGIGNWALVLSAAEVLGIGK